MDFFVSHLFISRQSYNELNRDTKIPPEKIPISHYLKASGEDKDLPTISSCGFWRAFSFLISARNLHPHRPAQPLLLFYSGEKQKPHPPSPEETCQAFSLNEVKLKHLHNFLMHDTAKSA